MSEISECLFMAEGSRPGRTYERLLWRKRQVKKRGSVPVNSKPD